MQNFGHLVFIAMHFAALAFLPAALFISIPAHLVFAAIVDKPKRERA